MHEYLTRELFRAISGGWRNPGDLAAVAWIRTESGRFAGPLLAETRATFSALKPAAIACFAPRSTGWGLPASRSAPAAGCGSRTSAFLPVIEGFGARRMNFGLALVRLDLGRVYAEQGRFLEAGELADQAASTFADVGLPGKEAEARKLGYYAAHG